MASSPSPSITTISGPETHTIDTHELFFARRALKLLKTRLGTEGLKCLLADDIAQAKTSWLKAISTSPTTCTYGPPITITLRAQGLSAPEFLSWFKKNTSNLSIMQEAHPEHYINGLEVLETVGSHVMHFHLKFHPEGPPPFIASQLRYEEKYPICLSAAGVFPNDESETVVGYACHQFRDLSSHELAKGETKGLEVKLGGCMPEGIGEEVRESQRAHFAVEWRNWLRAALEDVKAKQAE